MRIRRRLQGLALLKIWAQQEEDPKEVVHRYRWFNRPPTPTACLQGSQQWRLLPQLQARTALLGPQSGVLEGRQLLLRRLQVNSRPLDLRRRHRLFPKVPRPLHRPHLRLLARLDRPITPNKGEAPRLATPRRSTHGWRGCTSDRVSKKIKLNFSRFLNSWLLIFVVIRLGTVTSAFRDYKVFKTIIELDSFIYLYTILTVFCLVEWNGCCNSKVHWTYCLSIINNSHHLTQLSILLISLWISSFCYCYSQIK